MGLQQILDRFLLFGQTMTSMWTATRAPQALPPVYPSRPRHPTLADQPPPASGQAPPTGAGLPITGASLGPLVAAGALLIAFGVLLIAWQRRRHN
jgi:LPXTG-motif cell wall-anchored protein